MKKIFVLLTLFFALCLCGCGEKKTSVSLSDIEIVTSSPAIATPVPTADPADKFKPGQTSGNIYTSEFFGLVCDHGDNMKHYGKTKLADMTGVTVAQFTEGDLAEMLLDSGAFCDMYCYTEDGSETMNLMAQYIDEADRSLSEEEIRDMMVPVFREEIVANGVKNIQLQKITEPLCGRDCFGLLLDAEIQGAKYYCRQFYIKSGNFLGVVSLCSFDKDTTPILKSMWRAK